MILDLSSAEIALLDQWREELDIEHDKFETWNSFIDFVHECQEDVHDRSDNRWVSREVCRIINIKFRLSNAFMDPHKVNPDNFPRHYEGIHVDSFRSRNRSIEDLLRDEIKASGYMFLLIRDLDDPI